MTAKDLPIKTPTLSIERETDELFAATGILQARLNDLKDRLSPVMISRVSGEILITAQSDRAHAGCVVADRIAANRYSVESAINTIDNLLADLQV